MIKWDLPKKIKSVEQWKKDGSADGAPPGCYSPNMSKKDRETWKGKIVGTKSGHPQVELRRSCGQAQVLIIVSLKGGYKYRYYKPDPGKGWDTSKYNMHLSLNGPGQFTFKDWDSLNKVVLEAIKVLRFIEQEKKDGKS